MARPKKTLKFTVRYEPAGRGWLTASVPSVPGTISMGRTPAEARANVLDALAEMLAVTPQTPSAQGGREERIRFDLGLARVLSAGHGRDL